MSESKSFLIKIRPRGVGMAIAKMKFRGMSDLEIIERASYTFFALKNAEYTCPKIEVFPNHVTVTLTKPTEQPKAEPEQVIVRCKVTGKIRYSQDQARRALTKAICQKNGPVRMYKCDHCKRWHLTSKLYAGLLPEKEVKNERK